MESTFIIARSELNKNFLTGIKSLFKDSRMLQITVSDSEDFGLYDKETREEYFTRLEKANENLNNGTNVIEFSSEEFEELVEKMG